MIRNYTKLSSLNLVLESVKGVIRFNTSFLFLFLDQIEDERSNRYRVPFLSSTQLNLNLCASREDREEKRRCRDTSVLVRP